MLIDEVPLAKALGALFDLILTGRRREKHLQNEKTTNKLGQILQKADLAWNFLESGIKF